MRRTFCIFPLLRFRIFHFQPLSHEPAVNAATASSHTNKYQVTEKESMHIYVYMCVYIAMAQ